ncbi:hypothetical protein [Actinoplanes sp. NPDC051494]|uniref:hypothetical protein n=1 Tax=Actinoplanes sp. NPDC051494 TaxID=3363907 RepID=UPI003792D811
MTDQLEQLLKQARTESLREVLAPGTDQVRRTVRRRRGILAGTGAVVAVGVIASGIALAGGGGGGGDVAPIAPLPVAPPPPSAELWVPEGPLPSPDPVLESRFAAADAALGDRQKEPFVMGTTGVVSPDYENHVNDMAADDYQLYVYCGGKGTIDVVVKAGQAGDTKLAAGTVECADRPDPEPLAFTQPVTGYLRVFLSGDKQASDKGAFSFKFVRVADLVVPASAESVANAEKAARLLTAAGVSAPEKVTTERDKAVDSPHPAGDYRASFGCAGPGTMSFIIRSGKTLRDGTVATNGQTQTAVSYRCTAAGKITKDVAMKLPAGSAFTVTAEADDPARDRAGWAWAITPA